MQPNTVDVTNKTGRDVTTAVESWQTPSGDELVEHLAGVDGSGRLLNFWWSPSTDWRVTDVSEKTGRHFTPVKPVAWQTNNGDKIVEHLALPDDQGNLIVCWWQSGGEWRSFDISSHTQVPVDETTSIASVRNWESGELSEYLYAANRYGDLVEFRFRPSTGWQASLVRREDGDSVEVNSDTIAAYTTDSPDTSIHVTAVSSTGDLIECVRPEGGRWSTGRISDRYERFLDGPTVTYTGGNIEHVAAVTRAHQLVVYWRGVQSHPGGWERASPSEETSQPVDAVASAYSMSATEAGSDRAIDCLTAVGGGNAYRFWWNDKHWWQVLDVTKATSVSADEPAEGWTTPNGPQHVEHVAAVSEDSLVVCWGLSPSRRTVEKLGDGREGIDFDRRRRRDAFLIGWSYRDRSPPLLTTVEDAAFGNQGGKSAADYFRTVSRGAFDVDHAGTRGWIQSDFDRSWYADSDASGEESQKWDTNHHRKYMEAITTAGRYAVDYAVYDKNHDRHLSPDELGVIIAVGEGGGGFVRTAARQESPWEPLVVDDVQFGQIAEWYAGDPPNVPILVHELFHLFYDLPDLYDTDTPYRVEGFDVMAQRGGGPVGTRHAHPCGVFKLMLGWARPTVPLRSGSYELPAVADSGKVIVLPREGRETTEFFVLENRQRRPYDDLPDEGLAVFHYVEGDDTSQAPHDVQEDHWQTLDDWRQRVRMIKPVITKEMEQSLWDGSETATGYDLVSDRPSDAKAALTWADGTPSGFAVRDIPPSDAVMTVTIDVP
jgi:M6 family metalloprotease-like protein